jgi:hypothetical protein
MGDFNLKEVPKESEKFSTKKFFEYLLLTNNDVLHKRKKLSTVSKLLYSLTVKYAN